MEINSEVTFKRHEIKYILTPEQYTSLTSYLEDKVVDDVYAYSQISNIYYDTPDYLLIKWSIKKPIYKEKLRLRCYKVLEPTEDVFVELKKKYKGIVYKQRLYLPLDQATDFLDKKISCPDKTKTGDNFTDFIYHLDELKPRMYIYYDRRSLRSIDDNTRITFDTNITWRVNDLDLTKGCYGNKLNLNGNIIMEVKVINGLPLWLYDIFKELNIKHKSFSKYGMAFTEAVNQGLIHPQE